MWLPICGWFDEMEKNKPVRERLKNKFIESQISGDRIRMEEVRKEWRELDEKENYYLNW